MEIVTETFVYSVEPSLFQQVELLLLHSLIFNNRLHLFTNALAYKYKSKRFDDK